MNPPEIQDSLHKLVRLHTLFSMKGSNTLNLYEEIMLLALRDKKGTVQIGYIQHTIAGSILAQFVLEGVISIEDSRKKLVDLTKAKFSGNPILDEAIDKLSTAKRRASLATWVGRLARIKNLKNRVAQQLCDRGILSLSEDKILFIFTRKLYPEINPKPEMEIIERLRKAIFEDGKKLNEHDVVLISLADSTGLLTQTFGKKEVKAHKKRIEQITNGEIVGKATKEVIAACQTAVMVATVIVPITAAH